AHERLAGDIRVGCYIANDAAHIATERVGSISATWQHEAVQQLRDGKRIAHLELHVGVDRVDHVIVDDFHRGVVRILDPLHHHKRGHDLDDRADRTAFIRILAIQRDAARGVHHVCGLGGDIGWGNRAFQRLGYLRLQWLYKHGCHKQAGNKNGEPPGFCTIYHHRDSYSLG